MANETASTTATDAYQYIGCYKDVFGDRDFGLCVYDNKVNTPRSCTEACAEKSTTYAGLQVKSHG